MKIVDQTPYYKDKTELSVIDRGKAIMKFGPGWFKEIEAERIVIAVLDQTIDKKFTILHNVTPPGLNAMIPLILVGPTGVYVMSVTNLFGTFSAKGDQWGNISGSSFNPAKPNLLTRIERMARAIQLYLQRQGFGDLTSVEPILLCANPTLHVDSMRPIVRVVMRDALERFAVSVAQARVILGTDQVNSIVDRLLNPAAPPAPVEMVATNAADESAQTATSNDPFVPAFAQPGAEAALTGGVFQPAEASAPIRRRRPGITGKQWALLAGMMVFWCISIAAFGFFIYKGLNP